MRAVALAKVTEAGDSRPSLRYSQVGWGANVQKRKKKREGWLCGMA